MAGPLSWVFQKIDDAFEHDGRNVLETRFSRAVQSFVSRHLILGTIFQSFLAATCIALLTILFPNVHFVPQTLVTWGISFVVFFVWLGLYNRWKRQETRGDIEEAVTRPSK
jgi:uncharacterized Tic20 family protein